MTNQLPWAKFSPTKALRASKDLQSIRSCPLCMKSESTEIISIKDFQFYDDESGPNRIDHTISICDVCGMVYTNPCYTPDGFAHLFEKAGQSYGHSPGRMDEQSRWIREHIGKFSSICDIGCGSGDFLSKIDPAVVRTGIDIDLQSIERARKNYPDIEFIQEDFEKFDFEADINLYTMFHVLEHLPNPLATLKAIRSHANEGSMLLIEVPVLDYASKDQNHDIVGFYSVQHLTHFSVDTLCKMLRASGWIPEIQMKMDGYNGYRVVSVPGTAEKTESFGGVDKLSKMATGYAEIWRENIKKVQDILSRYSDYKRMIIWGGGQHLEYLAKLTNIFQTNAEYIIVDSDPLKWGYTVHNIPILSPDDLPVDTWIDADIFFLISSYGGQPAIYDALNKKGVDHKNIIQLYNEVRVY